MNNSNRVPLWYSVKKVLQTGIASLKNSPKMYSQYRQYCSPILAAHKAYKIIRMNMKLTWRLYTWENK